MLKNPIIAVARGEPFQSEEFCELVKELHALKGRVLQAAHVIEAGLGDGDELTIRTRDVAAAIQRLQWTIERRANEQEKSTAA